MSMESIIDDQALILHASYIPAGAKGAHANEPRTFLSSLLETSRVSHRRGHHSISKLTAWQFDCRLIQPWQ